jgi:hypothetical protein
MGLYVGASGDTCETCLYAFISLSGGSKLHCSRGEYPSSCPLTSCFKYKEREVDKPITEFTAEFLSEEDMNV